MPIPEQPTNNVESLLFAILTGDDSTIPSKLTSRVEELLFAIYQNGGGGGGGGGGTTNYNLLSNLPKIAGVELKGNKTLAQLGIQGELAFDNTPTEGSNNPVKSSGIFSTFAALRSAINQQMSLKVDKISGKGLSTNDYTTDEKTKLSGIESNAEVNIIGEIVVNGTPLVPVNKSVAINILTKSVDDLVNYYTKTQTYTKEEVNNLVNSISSLTLDIVSTLPTEDISTTTIYLLPVTGATNVYMQYAYINNEWAQLGTTQVDLTNYYTKAQIDTYLALKQDLLTFDDIPTANSNNPVKSGGIKTALDGKEDTLQLDLAPTEDSAKYLNSGSIFTALAAKLAEAKSYTDAQIANFGGFEFADSLEDITNPNTKTIYLVKDFTATGNDKYREYVYKVESGTGSFEQIGDTSITLSPATVAALGLVKPDGTSITIDVDGTIHAAAGVDFDEEDFAFDSDIRMVSLAPAQRIFTGTKAEWDSLTTAIKKTYGIVNITDDGSDSFSLGQRYVSEDVTVSETAWASKVFDFSTNIPKGKYLIGAKFTATAGNQSVLGAIKDLTCATLTAGYGPSTSIATSEIYVKDTDGTASMEYSCAITNAGNPLKMNLILIKIG